MKPSWFTRDVKMRGYVSGRGNAQSMLNRACNGSLLSLKLEYSFSRYSVCCRMLDGNPLATRTSP